MASRLVNKRRRLRIGLAGAVVFSVLAAGAILAFRARTPQSAPEESPSLVEEDPRLTFPSSFRNTHPDVPYAREADCARCHPDKAEAFAKHPMGYSLTPVANWAAGQRYDAAVHNPFLASGASFEVERQGDKVFHKEIHGEPHATVSVAARYEVRYVIGAGRASFAYLIDLDGFLIQSPIGYYTQKTRWDLSPGYENRREVFERPITVECIFCHGNRAQPARGTLNHYQAPIFADGLAIGCQRCHGPGALHVERREREEKVTGPDDTIVNPKRLPWELREGVCQQCHLEGEKRILKRGREYYDYRPGLPWQMFWTVFVRDAKVGDNGFDNTQQMYSSRCFQASKGAPGCTTCHDPHQVPDRADKVAYYRSRCLQCHEKGSPPCSLPPAARKAQSPLDDCRVCHMSSRRSNDIPHTSITDHRILRKPDVASPASPPGEITVRPFSPDVAGYRDQEAARALALFLLEKSKGGNEDTRLTQVILPALEEAARNRPDDLPAQEARAHAYALLGRPREALAICETILAVAPDRETTLHYAANITQVLKMPEAVGYWQRLVDVNPSSMANRAGLAKALAANGDWRRAVTESEAIVRQYPPNLAAHLVLLEYYVNAGDREHARSEFEQAQVLNPRNLDGLRRWFDERMK